MKTRQDVHAYDLLCENRAPWFKLTTHAQISLRIRNTPIMHVHMDEQQSRYEPKRPKRTFG